MASSADLATVTGGCHCGQVRFEVDLPPQVESHGCTCSICAKTGFIHIIVPESRFRLTSGETALHEYTFNTGVARHLFCRHCGVKSFYKPRSNPDGWSVNETCLDRTDAVEITRIAPFDGQNWEANAAALAHLSQEQS